MKKKILALLLALIMVLSLVACGDKEEKNENPNLITIGDHQALFTGAYITKDYDGDDAIVISLTYTNNSEETNSFMWAMFYSPMQGGAVLSNSTIFKSADSYEYIGEENMDDVAPGSSLEVALTYKLNNNTDPVIISFSDLLDEETGELTIDVTELEVKTAPDAEGSENLDSEPVTGDDSEQTELTGIQAWSGDYYGYWVIDSVWANVTDWVEEGNYWDTCATLELNEDGTGTLIIWDEDFTKDEPLAQMGITASETGGVGRFVCEDGDFLGLPLAHADWLWYTDATEYGDMFVINGQFDDGEDDFWYEIYLRPWGTDWSDVAANGEPIPYYYDDWYVPLVNSGVTEAPAGPVAGESVEQPDETPGEQPDETPDETSAPDLPFETGIVFGDGMVTLQQLKDFKAWIWDLSKPTHEEMVAQMGVNPRPGNLNMWKEGEQIVYSWTDGKDFVTVTLKPTEDGSSWVYKAVSWTGGVND